jgi:hypothetical protein
MVKLELNMAEPIIAIVKVVKDKKTREKKRRKPDPPRTNQAGYEYEEKLDIVPKDAVRFGLMKSRLR